MNLLEIVQRLFRSHGLLILFAGIFLLVGLGVLGWGILLTIESLASRSWPVTQGTVTVSQVTSYIDNDDSGSTRMYEADVQYIYRVNGEQLQGSQVNLGNYSSSNPNGMKKIVARYPQGSQVKVFYDPANPEKAILEPGFSPGLLIPLGIGLAFSAVGSLVSVWLFRNLLSGSLAARTS